jgi:hypothetical protein
MNYANSRYPKYATPLELITMATSIPAKLVRLDDRIGKLAKGFLADFIVVRRRGSASAAETVVTASPADLRLVVIGGQPTYGDEELLTALLPTKQNQFQRVEICGHTKVLYFGDTTEAWDNIRQRLENELQRHGLSFNRFECN